LLIFLCMYFIITFKIMKAEEKDCLEKFDHTYASYYKKTKMIINISFNNSRQKRNNKI
jgi:protein-S-isoprenylcysteine O-methyltransferase Ste14